MSDACYTFGIASDAYADARPRYPAALYDWILTHCAERETAWDCATGNGQAAIDLASRFQHVWASDMSPEQVAHGAMGPNIEYLVSAAEATDYPAAAFDLITVAQALHWFDYSRFWAEVRRVARPNAFFCAWGYSWFSSPPEVDARLVQPFLALIEPYWAANNAILWRGYQEQEIDFPFAALRPPPMAIDVTWTLAALVGYLKTWSAYKRAMANPEIAMQLEATINAALASIALDTPFEVSMPLTVIGGRVDESRDIHPIL